MNKENGSTPASKQESLDRVITTLQHKKRTVLHVLSLDKSITYEGKKIECHQRYDHMTRASKRYAKSNALTACGDKNGVSAGNLIRVTHDSEAFAVIIVDLAITKQELFDLKIGATLVPFNHTGQQAVKVPQRKKELELA